MNESWHIEFDKEIVTANRRWIKPQRKRLYPYVSNDIKSIRYLTSEKILDGDDIASLSDMTKGNDEIKHILNEYVKGQMIEFSVKE